MNAPSPAAKGDRGQRPPRLAREDPETAQKRSDLRRMRGVATSLLVAMALLFAATSFGLRSWPWLAYPRAFAEAAMVGACADWFAVVALFRQPFGLPIPHTGIVPQNKERIGVALGRFISNNFLSPTILAERLNRVDPVQFACDWLNGPGNAERVAAQAKGFLPRVLEALPRERLVDWLTDIAVRGVGAIPAAPVAAKGLAVLWARGETQALLDLALEWGEDSLLRNKELIRAKVSGSNSRLIPKWVDSMLVDRVINGLQSTLAEMRRPEHPWRQEIKRAIEDLIDKLARDPILGARVEAMKREMVANPAFIARTREVCEALTDQILHGLAERSDAAASALAFALLSLGQWLDSDSRAKAGLNRWVRRATLRALSPRRAEIGAYIADVVAHWDATTLVNRVELQVGRDLQYIRINGTLVGGLVGLLIFVASRWIPGF